MATKLYVGNLSFSTTENKLNELFAEHGEVKSVNIPTDRETGRSRGFAFVEMESDEKASAAITALNETDVDGRKIKVDKAMERQERTGGQGGRRFNSNSSSSSSRSGGGYGNKRF